MSSALTWQMDAAAEAGGRASWQPGPGAAMLAAELHALGINSRTVRIPCELRMRSKSCSAGLAAFLQSMCMAFGVTRDTSCSRRGFAHIYCAVNT